MSTIFVFGETCVDRYTYGTVSRLAPDKPVPVLDEVSREDSLGMAGNVFRNLVHLGQSAELITNQGYETIVKERFVDIDTNHMFLRRDFGQPPLPLSASQVPSNLDVIVISDYDKGFLSELQIQELCSRSRLSFLDTKKRLGPWATSASIIKINEHEYRRSANFIESNPELNLVQTLGSRGAVYRGQVYSTQAQDVIDVSGAGDTFLAALVTGFLDSGSIEKAIGFANQSAQRVVSARGVSLP